MIEPDPLLERAAYHEADHCVPAIVFGIPIISVTIEADVPHFHRGRWRSESDMALANLVTLCLAGPAAETIHIGPITDGSDHIDYEMARRYLAEGGVDRLLAGAALTPLSSCLWQPAGNAVFTMLATLSCGRLTESEQTKNNLSLSR
jgi:hypothetical protein